MRRESAGNDLSRPTLTTWHLSAHFHYFSLEMLPALTKAYDRLVEALNNLKAEQNKPEVSSSEEIGRLRDELKTEELQQLAKSVKKSLDEEEEESDQRIRTATLVLNAEHVICCAEFSKLQTELQPDLHPLSEKVKQLTKEVETLNKKAGKFSGELDDLVSSLQDLSSDLVVLGGPVIENHDVLEKIFSYLRDPASVKAVSLVSR